MNKHYVIRSMPLCGVKVVYLAQMIQLDNQLWATAKKQINKIRTVPWLSTVVY